MNHAAHPLIPSTPITRPIETMTRRLQKKFKCQVCLKKLSSKHCLIEHGYSHSNQKPYKCRACDTLFKHASQLSVHKKTHRVLLDIKVPKLTDLLPLPTASPPSETRTEVIHLPIISNPQVWHLPSTSIISNI